MVRKSRILKKKKTAKPTAEGKTTTATKRVPVLGFGRCRLCRFLGANGATIQTAVRAFAILGVEFSPKTASVQVVRGRNGVAGVDITPAVEKKLLAALKKAQKEVKAETPKAVKPVTPKKTKTKATKKKVAKKKVAKKKPRQEKGGQRKDRQKEGSQEDPQEKDCAEKEVR